MFHAGWYGGPFLPFPKYLAMLEARWMLPVWRGDFGVDVFFVLSGFLISGLLIEERSKSGTLALARFYSRRLLRLWPALCVAAALEVSIIGDNSAAIWANLFYVSNFVPILHAAMGWTWSLAIEEQFYLVCPWLVGALANRSVRARMVALFVLGATLCAVGAYVVATGGFQAVDAEIAVNRDFVRWSIGFDHLYVKPWMRAGPLLCGVAAAYLFRAERFMERLSASRALGILGAGLALVIGCLSTHWPMLVGAPRFVEVGFLAVFRTTFGAAVAYLVLFSLSGHSVGRQLGRWLSHRAFYPLAQLAYGAYLLNPIVCTVVHGAMRAKVIRDGWPPMAAFLPLDVAATFVGAAVLYVFVERPFMVLRPVPKSEVDVAPAESGGLERALLPAAILGATVVAWFNRFIQDDAYISFRYARHWATGHGLVWNVGGPPIQGFTNPLWTLLIAIGFKLGLEPARLSQWMGLACFAVGLWAVGSLSTELLRSRRVAIAVVVGLGFLYSFNAYATGGLETQSQAMLVALTWLGVARGSDSGESRPGWLAFGSAMAGLAIASRLDSALLVGPALAMALLHRGAWRSSTTVAAIVAPASGIVASLFAFVWWTFGALLPNTFYAKAGGLEESVFVGGVEYCLSFLLRYQLVPLVAVSAFLASSKLRTAPAVVKATLAAVVVWSLYVASVGGDFMEFRLLVPVLPLAAVGCAWALASAGEWLIWLFTLATVASSALYFRQVRDRPGLDDASLVETVHGLDAHLTDHQQDWGEVGRGLKHAFRCDPDVTIAVMAAGAVPYYSGLRTIDMLGLSDPWIARNGVVYGTRPGHRRGATLPYLLNRRANLVVHPWARGDGEQLISEYDRAAVVSRYIPLSHPEDLPADAVVIEIPIAPDRRLRALYLVRDPAVDRCIELGRWRVLPIRP